jgi:hypothetical protein
MRTPRQKARASYAENDSRFNPSLVYAVICKPNQESVSVLSASANSCTSATVDFDVYSLLKIVMVELA